MYTYTDAGSYRPRGGAYPYSTVRARARAALRARARVRVLRTSRARYATRTYSRASSCGMHVAAMTGTGTPPPVRGTQHSSLTKAPVSSAACVRPAAT